MKVDTLLCSANQCSQNQRQVVEEKVFRLTINGRDFVSLVASPYQPEQLITGFLYLQRMIKSTGDILSLGICSDSGDVAVTIRGAIAERLQPILTSGCGGGISFDTVDAPPVSTSVEVASSFRPEFVVEVMSRLFELSKLYSEHGGIHSAALCDASGLLLHAEDIGRHNTIDRIAGAALQEGIDTVGKLLLTSGRISSEMSIKAIRLGIAAIASRTSPTSLAVEICHEFKAGLAGYVRGGSMEIYANREKFGLS